MFELILAILLGFTCPNHTNTGTKHINAGQVTTMDDTGGETGTIPPNPPPPPSKQ